ncbi:MAG: trypsin-like peptidase domain-containing protein [Clostridia bacterium]|nr:trypsin-like peptidase domain-containing protein [Clostridia bacterium]
MRKRIISLIFAAAIMFSAFVPAMAETTYNNDVSKSVVYIETGYYDDNGDMTGERGTGFFIGKTGENPQYLITNYHVVGNALEAGGVIYVAYSQNNYEPAYFVAGKYNGTLDIAVLRLNEPTEERKPLKLMIPNKDLVGSDVYALGFPVISDVLGNFSLFSESDLTVTKGTLSRLSTEASSGARMVQHSATISSGSSGGPLVTPEGYVVGVNTYSTEDASAYFSLSSEEVIDILSANNIAYSMAEDEDIDWVFIAIIAGAVVVIALIIILIVVFTRKKSKPQVSEPPAESERNERYGYAVSMSPQHAGRRVRIDSMPIIIGRESSCNLVFDRSTPGVSKQHCQLAFNAQSGVFVLTDLNSSYGTYLINGTRLNPNVPYRLQSGDSFYLGGAENTIRLETE